MAAIHPILCIFLMLWSCHSSFKWWGSSFLPLNLGRPVMRAEGILCEPGQACDDSRNDIMWLRLSGQVMPLPLRMLILGTLCCEETKCPHGQTTCRCCGNSPAEVSAHRSSNCQHGVMRLRRSQPPAFIQATSGDPDGSRDKSSPQSSTQVADAWTKSMLLF